MNSKVLYWIPAIFLCSLLPLKANAVLISPADDWQVTAGYIRVGPTQPIEY